MKVLIVSFDKTLIEALKSAFSDHEVFIAKNSEEAIKMIPSDIDVVVYDAISGAISEEDINTLYTKKFSNSRYLILYDELFPVDMNNIIPPAKMRIPRDEDPSSIASKLTEIPEEAVSEEVQEAVQQATAPPEPEIEIEPTSLTEEPQQEVEPVSAEGELEIEPTSLDVEEVAQEAAEMITEEVPAPEEEIQEAPEELTVEEAPVEELPVEEAPAEVKEQAHAPAPSAGGNKVLIVSFDQTLIDSIRNALGGQYQVESVKTVRQAIQKGTDASVVIFDAISGVIAEKGLIDLSNDQYMKDKPYIILVDDLFPINVEGIPLEKKESLSRDTDPARIRDLIAQIALPAEVQGEVQETVPAQEAPPEPEPEPTVAEVQEAPTAQETPEMEEVPEIAPEEVEEVIEQVQEEVPAETPVEEVEEEIPALEALGRIIEEQKEEVEETEVPSVPAVSSAELKAQIKEAVRKAIDEKMTEIGGLISDLVRTEIERVFGQVDIEKIVKETASQILREKLDELVS